MPSTPSIHTYILKIASRCNINCSYCYVYNKGDDGWKSQPKLMSADTIETLFVRIAEHAAEHQQKFIHLVLHGGEPFMGGIPHLEKLTNARQKFLTSQNIDAQISAQTNGLLLNPELCDFLLEHNIGVGISIDGPPRFNDQNRIDHQGRGTSSRLEEKLLMLSSEKYRPIFGGFLSVMNPDIPPQEYLDYVARWNPPRLDILWPNDHHERFPEGKASLEDTRYGEWVIDLYDQWVAGDYDFEIRELHDIMKLILGGHASSEVHGLTPVDLAVVETNGNIEAADTLKGTYPDATQLGFNILSNSFSEAITKVDNRLRQEGLRNLSDQCQNCEIVKVCGGGHITHRYSASHGFNNASVYCEDLRKVISHIRDEMKKEFLALPESQRPEMII